MPQWPRRTRTSFYSMAWCTEAAKLLRMAQIQKKVLRRLLLATGIMVVCPLLATLMVFLNARLLVMTLAFGTMPLFFAALLLLFFSAWQGATVCGMAKMDAWWWVSFPYPVIFGLYFRLLRLDRFAVHLLAPYVLVFMITVLSAGLWTLVTICRVLSSRAYLKEKKNIVMVIGVLFLGIVLWAMKVSPRR